MYSTSDFIHPEDTFTFLENKIIPKQGEVVDAIIESAGIFGIFVKFIQDDITFTGFVFWTNTLGFATENKISLMNGDLLERRFELYPIGKQIKCIVLPIHFIGQQYHLAECN